MRDEGSIAVLMSAVTALVAVVLAATGILGGVYAARSQAALAADAAALAAAVATYPGSGRGPPALEAATTAAVNGARLGRCICAIDASMVTRVATVTVVVDMEAPFFGVLEVVATSRAEFDPRAWLGR